MIDNEKRVANLIKKFIYSLYKNNSSFEFKQRLQDANNIIATADAERAQKIMDYLADMLIEDFYSEEHEVASGVIVGIVESNALKYFNRERLFSKLDEDFCVKNFYPATLAECNYNNTNKNA